MATPLQPGEQRYVLPLSDGTYVDIDSRRTALDSTTVSDFHLDFGRLFPEQDVLLKFATDDEATSYQGCDAATRIEDVAFLGRLERDESVCVQTTEGSWAALKVTDMQPSSSGLGIGDVTFAVRLFPEP